MENLSPEVLRQIRKEIVDLVKEPLDGITVTFNEEDISNVQAKIIGPGQSVGVITRRTLAKTNYMKLIIQHILV